jgi:hypothetical protein
MAEQPELPSSSSRPRQAWLPPVLARRAQGSERQRLWARWAELDKNLEAYAARRPTETAVVVFEPRLVSHEDSPTTDVRVAADVIRGAP